ncbi:MAG: helix-turn-helix domain-containing protein [Bryobacteraceae bacterium]
MELLTAQETARILKVGVERVYNLVRMGILPAVRLGRHIRIVRSTLEEFLANGGRGFDGGWRRLTKRA